MTNYNSIAILITCHNRKEKTLRCLQALFDQNGVGKEFAIEVFLVDDGCTDGTPDEIRSNYPDVNIIQGNGDLYWNRGMHLAWETAASTKDFDYYLWLNDDTFLFENAFKVMFKKPFFNSIICGTTKSLSTQNATYGAFKRKLYKLIIPNGEYQQGDYCNGNCVLIPRNVFKRVGNLDSNFQHALGDFDYGLRAQKIGIEVRVAPEFVGFCESHEIKPKWRSSSFDVNERFKNLYSPVSGCSPPEFFVFEKRHNGILLAIRHVFSVHVRCLFPQLFK